MFGKNTKNSERDSLRSRFWLECSRRAFKGTSEFANDWQWVFGVPIVSLIGTYFASEKGVTSWTTGYPIVDAFLSALTVFLITAAIAFSVRIYKVAPTLYEEQVQLVDSLQDRLRPAMRVFLENVGVYTFLMPDLSRSHFVQVSVAPTTDMPLLDCEVHVTGLRQVNSDGSKTPLLDESSYCTWSNEPVGTTKRNIPVGITKRANLFSRNEKDGEITLQITHPKVITATMTYTPGKYEIDLLVSAKDTVSVSRSYLFRWESSFDDISLTETE